MSDDPPCFDVARVEAVVHERLGARVSATALPSERDQNFALAIEGEARLVLKVAAAGEDRAFLVAQQRAMQHVAARTARTPRVVAWRDGETLTEIAAPDGRVHLAWLVTRLPGVPLAQVARRSEALLARFGAATAELAGALEGFDDPALHRDFHWDLARGRAVIDRHRGAIDDAELGAAIDAVVRQFDDHTAPVLADVARGALHSDLNDYNVLVDGDDVTGIVDFGDMVHGIAIGELAIAAGYAMLDAGDPLSVLWHLVHGYHARRAIGEAERTAVFGLAALRLGMSACLAAVQQRRHPDNAYLGVSQAPVRRTLPRLARTPFSLAAATVRSACVAPTSAALDASLARRRARIGRSVRVAYRRPLHIVRGERQYLFDADGRRYLDAYNNVPHVGHCHPRVVAAAARQNALLNTNTRYLHDGILAYADQLVATLPAPLGVCFFVSAASEANELAIRLARAATGRRDLLVLDAAYHGNTTTLIDASPYKHAGPGGHGAPAWVRVAPLADDYRGAYRRGDRDAGARYAADAAAHVDDRLAAFLAESCPSVGGQIMFPPGYLAGVYRAVRAAGGVCIADEVQTGLGRLGTAFWGFADQGVVPDIVVLGKSLGNGHPLAAVVTTPAIADAFDNGMEYFSTYGGNPVACAVGAAVLDVLRDEELQAHARAVGDDLLAGLRALQARHARIGDVRGSGLFLGAELVEDRASLAPATDAATYVANRMRDEGILLGTDGPLHNVIKIRPPMPFDAGDAAHLLATLDRVLGELSA
ncbi:MAG TPA: aminotransferase class III-fold pyridoxal phosphate-dependent enzyme [Kofleriaceae bacterium]|nr:aminotransferase class III-fold pyridoxal phosphate-dependent enzyme [Kofleriaceae bacterium]